MNRSILILLTSFVLLPVLSFLLPVQLNAQNNHPLQEWLESYRFSGDFQTKDLLEPLETGQPLPAGIDHGILLHLKKEVFQSLRAEAPLTLSLPIPNGYGGIFELELVKVELYAPEFSTGTLGLYAQESVPYQPGIHYRGILKNNTNSMAAISIFENDVMGMIVTESGQYQLGALEDAPETFLLYRVEDLDTAPQHSCFTDENLHSFESEPGTDDRGVGCKVVQVYLECDYKLFQDKGSSTTNVNNYISALFNQTATLYANENIGIAISQIFVWTTPDPYLSFSSTAAILNAFRTTKGTNFNGNLAHFLSTRNLGGGIAYVDVICLKQYAFGVSAINTSYQNVPVYSWSVEVLTHELGHNLGAWHTHSCNWPSGALDNCVSPEGNCSPGPAPVNGGTIMSYCHLTSNGINFNNGFGAVPGNHIRNKVLNASCLQQTGSIPTGLSTTNISGSGATANWGAVVGATSYSVQYKTSIASTWINAGNTTSATMTLGGLSSSTNYQWKVKTDCSDFSTISSFTTGSTNNGGGCPVPSSLSATNITTSSSTLNWAASAGASSYTVQYKTSTSSLWLTAGNTAGLSYNLSGLNAGVTYNWKVKANCSNYAASISFTTASNNGGGGSGCSAPINLNNLTVTASAATINWSSVSGALNYTLQIKYANSNTYFTLGTVATTQVTLSGLQANSSYFWRVKANCSGYSVEKALNTPANLEAPPSSSLPYLETGVRFELYPNPGVDRLNIQYNAEISGKEGYRLLDMTGKVLLEGVIGSNVQEINVSGLPSGIFFLEIMENGARMAIKKWIKQ
jgi:hypothetical protein